MQLYDAALASGQFPLVSARRLRDIVTQGFAPRYLKEPYVAAMLQHLAQHLNAPEFKQLLFLYTARANPVLADFVREVYWPRYAAGRNELNPDDALNFVTDSVRSGKTHDPWQDETIKRVASSLVGCCADFGLLTTSGRNQRIITVYRIAQQVALILVYALKFASLGDNQIVGHPDWQLFGLTRDDVRDQLKRLSLQGHLIFQAAADVVHIGWAYKNMEEVINVITRS